MASNRIYPEKTCANPACQDSFYPHDFRQDYCCAQCRINFHNDRRRHENEGRYSTEKALRRNDNCLESLYESDFGVKGQIEEKVLKAFGIDFGIGTPEENLLTRRPIWWYHSYGLELTNKEKRLYTIHLRTNN